jgi:hypothetical protein
MPRQSHIIGARPEYDSIRVRVQRVINGRPKQTISYTVYGEKLKDVAATVESGLIERYGGGQERNPFREAGVDHEESGPSVAQPGPRKRRLALRRKKVRT